MALLASTSKSGCTKIERRNVKVPTFESSQDRFLGIIVLILFYGSMDQSRLAVFQSTCSVNSIHLQSHILYHKIRVSCISYIVLRISFYSLSIPIINSAGILNSKSGR